jgi:hypothetical protein
MSYKDELYERIDHEEMSDSEKRQVYFQACAEHEQEMQEEEYRNS